MKPYQKKIVELMEKMESLLSEIYGIFAERFPEHKEFWSKMSDEEASHARIVSKLHALIEKGDVLFDEGKIKTYTMNTLIDHIEKVKTKVETEDITILQALTYANDFEQSLVEKNAFSHFDSASAKVRIALKALAIDTERHRNVIKVLKQELSQ